MSAFKLITFLFPFVKEMLLGEKTIREALKTNKMRVFLIGLILLSFFLNMTVIPRMIRISADYVLLDRKYKDLEEGKSVATPAPKPVQPPKQPEKKPEHPLPDIPYVPPVAQTQPLTPVPVPQQESPTPPADVPPQPNRERRHRGKSEPHSRTVPTTNSPEATARYREWKKSLDEIRQQEAHESAKEEYQYWTHSFPDVNHH